jgi:hypothetical protein
MKGILAIVLHWICWSTISAQPFTDIVSLQYQYHLPKPDKQVDPGKKALVHFSTDVLLPLSLKNGSYILTGAQYSSFDFRTLDVPSITERTRYVVFELRLGILHQWKSEQDKTLLMAIPKWSGDQPYLDNENFQIGLVALHTHRVSEQFAYKLGFYYNKEFFGNFYMPLIGLEWQIKDDLLLYGVLPGNLHLFKTFTPSVSVSLSYQSTIGSLMNRDGYYIRIGKEFPPYVMVFGELHWMVAGPVLLKLGVGHTIWRHYGGYRTEGHDPLEIAEQTDYNDGLILKASTAIRLYK